MGHHRVYRKRHDRFGKHLLMLRTRTALSQIALADASGVHRRSVQKWEMGESYPQAETLQRVIAVLLAHGGFAVGREIEEAATLWRYAAEDGTHPRAPFDDLWMTALLTQDQQSEGATRHGAEEQAARTLTPPLPETPDLRFPIIDWGEALAAPTLYGRTHEQATLEHWIIEERCRVVTIVGLGGIGKSSLAISFAQQSVPHFDHVVFRSLQNSPPLGHVLDHCIGACSEQQATPPERVPDKITLLIQLLRERRCLLMLDNFETILQADALTGTYRAGYADYGLLLQRLSERDHQSCLMLTSREKPTELGVFEGHHAPVRTLALNGLDDHACALILKHRDIVGTPSDVRALVRLYGGSPLAMNLVVEPIRELFGGDITAFLATGNAFFNGLDTLLEQQCRRLTPLELTLVRWLVVEREVLSLSTLLANLANTVPQRDVLIALESLRRRSLIERASDQKGFRVHPVILEWMTNWIVDIGCQEIITAQPRVLNSHALVRATANEYLRVAQEHLLAQPLLAQLIRVCGTTAALEQRLCVLLDAWRDQPPAIQNYGPGNVINLLRLLCGNLRGLDLSHLLIRHAYLQGVDMQDTDLSGATMHDSVFTEIFDAPLAVVVNRAGSHWAASSRSGEVMVWAGGGQTLHRMWRAHDDMIWTLDFSPDGATLATGSWDGTVKLWDVASGTLLWTNRHTSHLHSVAFAPQGNVLASGGNDGGIHMWDVATGQPLFTLPHAGPTSGAGITWSPDGRLLASGDAAGSIRVWEWRESGSAICIHTIAGHTAFVDGLAFSPDGRSLASASWDGTAKLWDVASGDLQQTLVGHSGRLGRVMWSPDQHTLAVSGNDPTIWLWDVPHARYRATLQGHTDGVCGLAFTPDSHTLISCGNGTLRVWDTTNGHCIRVIQGYEDIHTMIDWSPNGTMLVSGSLDARVTIWDVAGTVSPATLRGHTGSICGVGWSPDNRWIASSEWNNTIRLWQPPFGDLRKLLRVASDSDQATFVYGIAWSPDGQYLACGTSRWGIQVWHVATEQRCWPEHEFPTVIRHIAWHPNGGQVVGGGDDGVVYVWDATDGTLIHQFTGHQSMITSVVWSPDGTRLVSGGRGTCGGELLVWNMQRGAQEHALQEHSSIVYALTWGADDHALISGSGDGKLRWWDAQRGVCVRVRDGHQGTVQALQRSPDGTQLVSCGDDGAIIVWDLRSGAYRQTLRRDRPYERLTITDLSGITEAQRTSLLALGARRNATEPLEHDERT